MHIEIVGNGFKVSDALSPRVTARLCVTLAGATRELSWIGAGLSRRATCDGRCSEWLAERVWEDDGGPTARRSHTGPAG